MDIHLRIHTGQEIIKKEQLCTRYEKVFSWRNDLESHIVVDIRSMPYLGDICSTGLSQKVGLKDHEQVNHKKPHPVFHPPPKKFFQKWLILHYFSSPKTSDIEKGAKTQYLEKAMQT